MVKAKKTAKKSPAKKAAKKTAKKPTKAAHGVKRDKDLPWNDKKVAVFKALKQLRAVNTDSAQSANDIAEKADVSTRDVRHYCYHAKAAGLVGVADIQKTRGYGFYLTTKGSKVEPAKELKARKAQ